MVEITWGNALGYGLRYVIYIIVWAIIGGLIMVGGGLFIAGSINISFNQSTQLWETSGLNLGSLIAGIVVMVIGELVVILGAIAAYFKLMSRLITEALSTTPQRPPPP
jgi:hypothetical protein